jgi:hypothetical protein
MNEDREPEMRRRGETMADGRRYIIYYTFGETGEETGAEETGSGEENV